MIFRDRTEAGQLLALELARYANDNPLVVGLPRGGVPVAAQIAHALKAPLDVFVVRKLGAPFQPEVGLGALAEDGTVWVDPIAASLGVDEEAMAGIIAREHAEADRRVRLFRNGRPFPDVTGRTVILVDDGIATGGTARVAVAALRARAPACLVLAVPVAAASTVATLGVEVDDLVCLTAPDDLYAIGLWYRDFAQVADEEVVRVLERARDEAARPVVDQRVEPRSKAVAGGRASRRAGSDRKGP